MRVDIAGRLVFDEEGWVQRFAYVMEESADACQQGIRADQLGSLFGQVRHLQAVLVGAGRVAQKVLQQRKIGPRDFDQLQSGGQSQRLCQEILQQQRNA